MRPRLSVDEHHKIGVTLGRLSGKCSSAHTLNRYKKTSTLSQIKRVARDIDQLRCKLDSLLFEQLPDVARPEIYYGDKDNHPMSWGDAVEELTTVGDTINGKVPAKIIDLYLRCDRQLYDFNSDYWPDQLVTMNNP